MYKILKMEKNHIEYIKMIERECFNNPWSYQNIESELYNENSYFIVCEKDLKVIAYASMYKILDEGYINNIAVSECFRKKGIAKNLIDDLILFALKNRLLFLSLEVRLSNKIAINLYNSTGFKSIGIRKNFYSKPKEDAIIMTRFFNKD